MNHVGRKPLFLFNVIAGLVIVVLYQFLAYRQWGENTSSQVFDRLMKKESAQALKDPSFCTPLFFIDITRETYVKWGRPLVTPRRELAGMIDWARRNGAKVIVVDILLDRRDPGDPAGDRLLVSYLNKLRPNRAGTKVVIPVDIDEDGAVVRPSILDGVGTISSGLVYFASPLLESNRKDFQVRYWHPYEIATDGNGRKVLIWSLPFLAAVLYQGREAELDRHARAVLDGKSIPASAIFSLNGGTVSLAPYEGSFFQDINVQRIRYRLIPRGLADDSRIVSIMRTPDILPLARDDLRGKIVVIGSSYRDSGDIHRTPVGEMPGMYVVGNAINTIAGNLQPVPSPWWFTTVLNVMAVILVACMFRFIPSYVIDLVVTLAISVLLFQLSWLAYITWGVYYNFLMPIAVMWLVQLSNEHYLNLVGILKKRREKKSTKEA